MGVRWYLQRELHGDTSRGADAALRIVIDASTVRLAGLGELDGVWEVGSVQEPTVTPRVASWGLAIERDGVVALLSFDSRQGVATLELDSGTQELAYMGAPVPAWLVGYWTVDRSRVDDARRERLGAGVIHVTADSLAYYGFGADAMIYPETWTSPGVRTTESGLVRLDFMDFDEAWLEVKQREGDRLVVYLGGVDALPWGEEMPVVRVDG